MSVEEWEGLLPKVESWRRKVLLEEIKDTVINFYESNKFSRMCPGKKEHTNSTCQTAHAKKFVINQFERTSFRVQKGYWFKDKILKILRASAKVVYTRG